MCTRVKLWVLVAGLGSGVAAGQARGGNLNPPAGAVGPTMKPLSEVEPRIAINATNTPGDAASVFKITQAGSYMLTANVTGVAGKAGIVVTSGNVIVDLNGFNVIGVPGSGIGVNGYPASRVTVRNGVISSWGGAGVSIGAGGTVDDLRVDHCGSSGIITSAGCLVRGCSGIANAGHGISVFGDSRVAECVADTNAMSGIEAGASSCVERCKSTGNTIAGVLCSGDSVTVQCCSLTDNGTDGVTALNSCVVAGNTCASNGDDGIQAGSSCRISGNTCTENGINSNDGGVYTSGSGNRIEDNHLMNNPYGLYVTGTDNFIVKNTARSNADNFGVVPGNEFAPVITNPGSNGFSTMTPWSNVAY